MCVHIMLFDNTYVCLISMHFLLHVQDNLYIRTCNGFMRVVLIGSPIESLKVTRFMTANADSPRSAHNKTKQHTFSIAKPIAFFYPP